MFRAGEKRVKRETATVKWLFFRLCHWRKFCREGEKTDRTFQRVKAYGILKPDIAEGSSELNPSLLSGLKENAEQVWKP